MSSTAPNLLPRVCGNKMSHEAEVCQPKSSLVDLVTLIEVSCSNTIYGIQKATYDVENDAYFGMFEHEIAR